MSEHVHELHEWKWSVTVPLICECGAALLPDDVERIVNATELLSSEDARIIPPSEVMTNKERQAYISLYAYSVALEVDE